MFAYVLRFARKVPRRFSVVLQLFG